MTGKADLLAAIDEAPLTNPPWRALVDAYRIALGGHSAQLMFALPGPEAALLNVDVSVGQVQSMRHLYYQRHGIADPFGYAALPVGKAHLLSDIVPMESFQRSLFYRDFCAPHRIEYGMTLPLGERDGMVAWLNVARDREAGNFTPADRTLAESLVPRLQYALRVFAALQAARTEQNIYSQMITDLRLAIAYVTDRGRILSASQSAERILRSHRCISIEDGHLRHRDPRERRWYLALLEQLARERQQQIYITRATCDCPVPKTTILLRSVGHAPHTGGHGHGDHGHDEPAFIMHIKESFRETLTETQAISRLFQLSPGETRLALMLATGSSIEEIADTLGITRNSVQTYCKRIFIKTGTRRQAELVGLVLDSASILTH